MLTRVAPAGENLHQHTLLPRASAMAPASARSGADEHERGGGKRRPRRCGRASADAPAGESGSGLTISFSGQIPVFSGNGIPFRNFGKFRRISLNFGRNLLNFEFENEIYRKIPKFRIPVTSGNEKISEISAKFR